MLLPESILQNRYRVVRRIAAGGMGAVYEAVDERLSRTVAIKETLAETDETLRAFEREARLLANLRHPALPNVSDFFSEGDQKYLVMEFIGGDDLSEILRRRGGPFAVPQVLRWSEEILDALIYLHGHEPPIIHRDIKPANLKLTPSGGVILLDFGLAKGVAGRMSPETLGRSLLGYSPNYASLEQIQGDATTPRSDLYSLAATLYHLLTNVKPADALKRVSALVNDAPDPLRPVREVNPEVPGALADAITRALAIKASHRPPSAAGFRAALVGDAYASPHRGESGGGSRVSNTPADTRPAGGRILIPVSPAREEQHPVTGHDQSLLSGIAGRLNAWRSARRAEADERAAERQSARAEREVNRTEGRRLKEKTGAQRGDEFMREPLPSELSPGATTSRVTPAADDFATRAQRENVPGEGEIEEMVRDVSVVRTEPGDEVGEELPRPRASDRAAREAKKLERATAAMSDYRVPPVDFLNTASPRHEQADEELRALAIRIAEKLKSLNVPGRIEYICPGPVFTTYEFKPDSDTPLSRIRNLADDLCMALRAESIRIDRVPGKAHVGIEVPNAHRDNIMLREVVESRQYQETTSKLALALGKTIDGLNYVADLARMPHLLIAGATGTGKSVCLNSLVVSILYKARPDEVKFIMIDPKRLELGLYADIPHLATPIITDPKRAANALKWAVAEMERRYKQLAQWGVRNIDGYNAEVLRRNLVEDFDEQGDAHCLFPYIVIVADEIAPLLGGGEADAEAALIQLAQTGRAAGLHMILATGRPSADVMTGLIKAHFPSRAAFRVSSKNDSRVIIDDVGAEQLLGRGDMLFLPPGTSRLVRVHGAFVDEAEIGRIVAHVKAQGAPVYDETITQSEDETGDGDGAGGERDEVFEEALRICVEMKRASTSIIQRRLRIGYGRAAAILDSMEREGFIGQADGARPRPVLGKAFETVGHWDELARKKR
jgi:S-DNA-T family DNA segregation ATPase FtsK/SpoIIIE